MKAIETKYIGPTDTRGARIKATDKDGHTLTLPYDYALDAEGNASKAANALCIKMKWHGAILQGSFPKTDVFVFVPDRIYKAMQTVDEVLKWASEPGNHGGNPYVQKFVQLARESKGVS